MSTDRLKENLDAVYRVAQAITLDARTAADLTERAFRRAHAHRPETWPDSEVRERLIRHVIEVHNESGGGALPLQRRAFSDAGGVDDADAFRERVAQDTLDRLLPPALALVPDHLRTLLMLLETENLSPPDAARVFSTAVDDVHARREQAYDLLQQALRRNASEVEREVLGHQLEKDAIRQALLRYARSRFAPPPPTLELPSEAPRPRSRTTGRDAIDRRSSASQPVSSRPRRILVALVLVLAAGLVGYVASALLEKSPEADLVTLSASEAPAANVALNTSSRADAESFLLEHAGRRVTIPEIAQATLQGAGLHEVADGVRVPFFVYRDDATGERVTVFAYSYVLLDRHSEMLRLAQDVMQQIEDEQHFDLHDLGEVRVLIWRHRDDIFAAVTQGDAAALQDRIRPAS